MIPSFDNFDAALSTRFNELAIRTAKVAVGAAVGAFLWVAMNPTMFLLFTPVGLYLAGSGLRGGEPRSDMTYIHLPTGIPYRLGIARNGYNQIGAYSLTPILRNDRYPNPPSFSYICPKDSPGRDRWERYPDSFENAHS